MASLHERLFGRIDARHDETVSLIQELVRVNSITPTLPGVARADVVGGETRVNEILRERYEQAGLETHWVAEDPERRNLVGIRRGSGGGRSLVLNAHVDTVAPVEPDAWLAGSPWNPEVRDSRLYGLGSTDMKSSGAAMWAVAQALQDEGVELAGELQLHSVVGEEMMEHDLGTSAVVRAGFRGDGAIVTEPTSFPRPLTVSTVAAGVWILRIVVEGKSTHCGNRPLAIRPGGPGDEIGVNALEKALDVVESLQRLEEQWGISKRHPCFSPGFFTIGPNLLHADAGVSFPAYFPHRAAIEYVIWYPPQESAEEVAREIEALRARRLPARHLAARPPARFRVAQPLAAHGDAVGARARADDGARSRGGERRAGRAPEPRAPGQFRRRQRRLVLRGRGHPRRRLRAGRPQARARPRRARAARRRGDGGEGARGGGRRLVRDEAMTEAAALILRGTPAHHPAPILVRENARGARAS